MALPADAHIGQVSLTVRDLRRSVLFYRDVLGFTETSRTGELSILAPPGGRTLIELHERKDAVARPRRSAGLYHFAILVPSRAVQHVDSAEMWYCGRIGFDAMVRGYPGALFVAAGGYHHHLGLNTWLGVGAPPPPDTAVGLRAFTIESNALQSEDIEDPSARVTVSMVHAG